MNPEQKLLAEIAAVLARNSSIGDWDYFILHSIFWISIIGSAVAALLTATGKGVKWVIAVLAALPALCLTVENTFSFTTRYSIRNQAVLELKKLRREIEITRSISLNDARKRLDEVEEIVSRSPLPRFATTDAKQAAPPMAKPASSP